MKIQNNISFGTKYRTVNILETTTLRCIESDSIADLKPIIDDLWPEKFKATGSKGYRYFLKAIGEKITNKYPEIQEATKTLKDYMLQNPYARKADIKKQSEPILQKLGSEIDITL